MTLIDSLQLGFATVLQVDNLFYVFLGVLLGQAVGVLPGIGAMTAISLLLPLTFYLDPTQSLIMLAGIYYGSQYGGAIASILLKLPGTPTALITCLDGYPMAQKGQARKALQIAAFASLIGSVFGMVIVSIGALPVSRFALSFGAPEYFALILLGLVGASVVSTGKPMRAIAMTILGILLGFIGTDINTGVYRFVAHDAFADGISLMAMAMGIFGVAEILGNIGVSGKAAKIERSSGIFDIFPKRKDLKGFPAATARGSVIGSVFGALPGTGAAIATFVSYAVEARIGKRPEEFGTGRTEGLAGPESANNAASITAFIPTLTLGIPGDPVMALMLGAMIINGITPGPTVVTENPELFWGVIASFVVGNLMLVLLNLPLIRLWVKFLTIPYWALYPAVLVFLMVGVYSFRNNIVDVYTTLAFGVLGVMMARLKFPAPPLLLGFILGPMLEEHLRRTMLLYDGDLSVFFTRPLSGVFMAWTILLLLLPVFAALTRRRRAKTGETTTILED
ncbi:tripartite tricarboxylate transporter permease [Leisingera sp. ANG59]|uniref:tripartite tricarboxylate transporter permease n=1 Tax=Leisingera sp. ANG59 TaxID=2675221 RepID=UPI001571C64E|nr:tripartite tricarboxylate transporter permease [Leisingera sp. ANG59]NSY39349.1 tripartite tricarboxylate transporter permease [Leisingera sp. ANG59]